MDTAPSFSMPIPEIAPWRAGNTGVEGVWTFDSGRPGRHAMITALVHGNELCGAWALKRLLEAGERPRQGRLTLAFCNLEAFDRFDRTNPDASRFLDEDLNRQWSSERLASPSTRERRRATALAPFVDAADWLLDLHSMHEPSPPLSLTGLARKNVELALAMKSPQHIVIDAGHREGVRMRDYGRFAPDSVANDETRSLLVECGFHGDPHACDVAQDQCLRFLEQAGTIDIADSALSGWRLPAPPRQQVFEVTHAIVATSDRFRFAAPYAGLETIPRAGTIVCRGDRDVTTPYDDCVLIMPSMRQARAGVTVVRFARAWDAGRA